MYIRQSIYSPPQSNKVINPFFFGSGFERNRCRPIARQNRRDQGLPQGAWFNFGEFTLIRVHFFILSILIAWQRHRRHGLRWHARHQRHGLGDFSS